MKEYIEQLARQYHEEYHDGTDWDDKTWDEQQDIAEPIEDAVTWVLLDIANLFHNTAEEEALRFLTEWAKEKGYRISRDPEIGEDYDAMMISG